MISRGINVDVSHAGPLEETKEGLKFVGKKKIPHMMTKQPTVLAIEMDFEWCGVSGSRVMPPHVNVGGGSPPASVQDVNVMLLEHCPHFFDGREYGLFAGWIADARNNNSFHGVEGKPLSLSMCLVTSAGWLLILIPAPLKAGALCLSFVHAPSVVARHICDV